MKTIPLVLVLSVCLPALAADETKPWPQKGDTVYVAAKLEGAQTPHLVLWGFGGGKLPDIPAVEACTAATLKSRSEEGDSYVLKDGTSHDRKLVGQWAPLLFRTEKECRAAVEGAGLPHVRSTGYRYTLIAPDSPTETAKS